MMVLKIRYNICQIDLNYDFITIYHLFDKVLAKDKDKAM